MYKKLSANISPFGGLTLVHNQLSKAGISDFINKELGNRGGKAQYSYADILLSRIYTALCGGNATEDVNYIRENTLQLLKGIAIPSADTILRADAELAVACDLVPTASGVENKINVNSKLNKFLLRSAIEFNQINPDAKDLVYDFDHQFIAAEKWDATYSYKKMRGYFPGVATIQNIPFSIEGRNGNCSVKTGQLATHKRNLEQLQAEGILPARARMDAGSYIKDVVDYFHKQGIAFFIRANQSEHLLLEASSLDDWKTCKIGLESYEVSSLTYAFGKHKHRMVVYRQPNSTGQIKAFTGDSNNYMFIITNDWKVSEKEAIVFYNNRGDSERVFDIQNNDFNWNSMPHSDLECNTVYLIIMAFAHVLYRYVVAIFAKVVRGLKASSRLKKFIFRVIAIPAKLVTTGRKTFYRIACSDDALLNLANST